MIEDHGIQPKFAVSTLEPHIAVFPIRRGLLGSPLERPLEQRPSSHEESAGSNPPSLVDGVSVAQWRWSWSLVSGGIAAWPWLDEGSQTFLGSLRSPKRDGG